MNKYIYLMMILGMNAPVFSGKEMGIGTESAYIILTAQEVKEKLTKILLTQSAPYEAQLPSALIKLIQNAKIKKILPEHLEQTLLSHIKKITAAIIGGKLVEFLKKITFAHVDIFTVLSANTELDKETLIFLNAGEETKATLDLRCSSKKIQESILKMLSSVISIIRSPINHLDNILKQSVEKVAEHFLSPELDQLSPEKLQELIQKSNSAFKTAFVMSIDHAISPMIQNYEKMQSAEQYLISQELLKLEVQANTSALQSKKTEQEIKACNVELQNAIMHLIDPSSFHNAHFDLNVKTANSGYNAHSKPIDYATLSNKQLEMYRERILEMNAQSYKNFDEIFNSLRRIKTSSVEEYNKLSQITKENMNKIHKNMQVKALFSV